MLLHIKVFYATAHREWHLLIQNETGAPYGTTHNSTAKPDDGYFQQETVGAIANLATATASDCAVISQLTSMVKRLMAELVTLNAKLVNSLQTKSASRGGCGGRRRGCGPGAPA